MIILFGYKKGGTMKSTLACSFAAYLAEIGRKVILVDTDKDQYTARNWAMDRDDEGYTPSIPCISVATHDGLTDTLTALENQYDFVVVDGHGGDTKSNRASLMICDAVVSPLAPTQVDLDTLEPWLQIFNAAKRINKKPVKLISVITQYTGLARVEQAKAYLANFPDYQLLDSIIKFRTLWQTKPAGKGASEMKQKHNSPMKNEFIAVAKELLQVIDR